MKACVVFECEGRSDSGFQYCSGVSNVVLDLEKIPNREVYLQVVQYLDKVPKLFDRPNCNVAQITNTLYKIYDMGLMDERLYERIGHFIKHHSYCGLILKVKPKGG